MQVTLSGVLNFFDGILSCCGEGKILVATANYKDRMDPALLQAGRVLLWTFKSTKPTALSLHSSNWL